MSTQHTAATAEVPTLGRPARPPRPAGYWERIERIVAQAPPLTDEQRARIRVALHGNRGVRSGAAA